jgi:hypothetical protein
MYCERGWKFLMIICAGTLERVSTLKEAHKQSISGIKRHRYLARALGENQ